MPHAYLGLACDLVAHNDQVDHLADRFKERQQLALGVGLGDAAHEQLDGVRRTACEECPPWVCKSEFIEVNGTVFVKGAGTTCCSCGWVAVICGEQQHTGNVAAQPRAPLTAKLSSRQNVGRLKAAGFKSRVGSLARDR